MRGLTRLVQSRHGITSALKGYCGRAFAEAVPAITELSGPFGPEGRAPGDPAMEPLAASYADHAVEASNAASAFA